MTKIAVLDDWQGVAQQSADWDRLRARAELVFFSTAFAGIDDAAAKLADFDIVLSMRERTPFPAALIARLPKLRMLGATSKRTATLDLAACTQQGIVVSNTSSGPGSIATAELALALLLACFRHLPAGDAALRAGRFQDGVPMGAALAGKTLGVIGLGSIGSRLARFGNALDMKVLAWSQNLTEAKAAEAGARLVPKDALLAESDAVTLHLVLSDRSRGIIGANELARMKPGAVLVNTSRGPLIDQPALLAALQANKIVAGLDVFDQEPLPPDHPLRSAPNTVLTPHLGYGVKEVWSQFYPESMENALAFLDGKPVRVMNPDVLKS